jgi:hypothetical protein
MCISNYYHAAMSMLPAIDIYNKESCERVQSYTQFGIPVFKMYCVNLIQKLNNFKN